MTTEQTNKLLALTRSFLTDVIINKRGETKKHAVEMVDFLLDKALFYGNKYGTKYFYLSLMMICKVAGTTHEELRIFIKEQTGIDSYKEISIYAAAYES